MSNITVKTLSSPCGLPANHYCIIAVWIWKIFPPLNLAIGTLGNLLNLVVLLRKRFRKQTTPLYLMCLAVTDTVFLWTGLLRNTLLHVKGFDMKTVSTFNCKSHEWVATLSASFSIWLLVYLTVERLIFTKFPLTARRVLTRRNTMIFLGVNFTVLALLPIHFVFGNELLNLNPYAQDTSNQTGSGVRMVCLASTKNYRQFQSGLWTIIVLLVYTILPNILVITGNAIIAWTLIRLKRKVQPTDTTVNNNQRTNSATRLLFLLSAFSLLSVTPFTVFKLVFSRIHTTLNEEDFAKSQLIYAIVFNSLCWNSMYNFILYIFGASAFRNELKTIVREFSGKVLPWLRTADHVDLNNERIRSLGSTRLETQF